MTADIRVLARVSRLAKSFPSKGARRAVLDDVNLELRAGTTTALLGPNAVGKTTLLRLIAGLDQPTSGGIWLAPAHDRNPIAIQFQEVEETLLPWRTNLDNASFGLEARGLPPHLARAQVEDLVATYDLPVPLHKKPSSSSGGERQMVAVLRAAVTRPQVLLLDEPFSRLGVGFAKAWWRFMRTFCRDANLAALIVTHNVVEAEAIADQVVVLGQGHGDGAITLECLTRYTAQPGDPEFLTRISRALEHAYA